MTAEQGTLFAIFVTVFGLLIWGRFRYDFVAFAGLIAGALLGVVPAGEIFAGFGHPAVIIIALVLIVSRGLMNSGAIERAAGHLVSGERPAGLHVAIMATVAAALSAIVNNVAALALLMPLDIEAAKKAKRAIAATLMPLSFASILGGMVTLIGTPPNIVIAQYREDTLGAPFGMFDFTPVGLAVAIAGVAFVATVGRFLIPVRAGTELLGDAEGHLHIAELRVGALEEDEERTLRDYDALADELDINLIGLIRRGRRLPGFARRERIAEGDFIVVEGDPKAIEAFMGKAKLDFAGSEAHEGGPTGGSLTLTEAIVPDTARLAGRSAMYLGLLRRHGVTLLGVSREGRRFRDRVRGLTIEPGDVILLLGTPERTDGAMSYLGVLPLEGRRQGVVQRRKAGFAVAAFLLAIAAAVIGVADLPVALAACAAAYAAAGLVGGSEVYEAVEWKVIVLLACLIPLGLAFERSGGAALIASLVLDATASLPAWAVLLALMVVTMTLSDFLNNVATALIAAPVGIEIARSLGLNPDPFLMGIAVAASCAFLTPIGHKNNTIIMGPGGYRFGDYWRLGLPLEILVLAVSLPMILIVWPLGG
jgi:di/tricarboxylate transporter